MKITIFLWRSRSISWENRCPQSFSQSNKVGTDGKAGGEYSLFEFNPCSAEEEEPLETLNFDFAGARWVESLNFRTFRTF